MNAFGEYVWKLRVEKKKLGLREAAGLIGMKAPYLSRIEAGRDNPPSLKFLKKMAEVYEVDLDDLIDQAKNRAAEVYGEEVVENPALNVLFKAVRQLDENELIAVIKKVCDETGEDPSKYLDEIEKRKKINPDIHLSRLTKEQGWLFPADIRPRILSKVDIAKMANSILTKHGMSREKYTPPTPIEDLIEQEGGIRFRMDMPLENFKNGDPRQLGMSNWSLEGFKEIHINASLDDGKVSNVRRLRFTVAHELFHCVEHLVLMDKKSRRGSAFYKALLEVVSEKEKAIKNFYVESWIKTSNKPRCLTTPEDWREWQADYFAACMLMPEWSVKKEFQKRMGVVDLVVNKSDIRKIACQIAGETMFSSGVFEKSMYQLYDVNTRAMAIRLMSLNLVRSL